MSRISAWLRRRPRRWIIPVGIIAGVIASVLAWPLLTGGTIGHSLWELKVWSAVAMVNVPQFSSKALERLYKEDQNDRQPPIDYKSVWIRDAKRRKICLAWLEAGEIRTPRDQFYAALIFQHGDEPEDYERAYQLAQDAAEGGVEEARWLKAAAEDRYLLSIGQPQRYGTQFRTDKTTGVVSLQPVDPKTTDEERARWNVPPLAESHRRVIDSE